MNNNKSRSYSVYHFVNVYENNNKTFSFPNKYKALLVLILGSKKITTARDSTYPQVLPEIFSLFKLFQTFTYLLLIFLIFYY